MTIEINHGMPRTNFFLIIQPKRKHSEPLVPVGNKNIVLLQDEKTGQVHQAVLVDVCSMNEYNFMHSSLLTQLTYGCSPALLKPELIRKYPELEKNFEIEYWLLKKMSKN